MPQRGPHREAMLVDSPVPSPGRLKAANPRDNARLRRRLRQEDSAATRVQGFGL